MLVPLCHFWVRLSGWLFPPHYRVLFSRLFMSPSFWLHVRHRELDLIWCWIVCISFFIFSVLWDAVGLLESSLILLSFVLQTFVALISLDYLPYLLNSEDFLGSACFLSSPILLLAIHFDKDFLFQDTLHDFPLRDHCPSWWLLWSWQLLPDSLAEVEAISFTLFVISFHVQCLHSAILASTRMDKGVFL